MLQILDHYNLIEHMSSHGDNFLGACPLHNGYDTSQFRVSLSKNRWTCFGRCKRSGHALDFVSLKEGISHKEAAIRITKWFAVGNARMRIQ